MQVPHDHDDMTPGPYSRFMWFIIIASTALFAIVIAGILIGAVAIGATRAHTAYLQSQEAFPSYGTASDWARR